IRDFHVTGVQTCALPISLRLYNGEKLQENDGSGTLPETNLPQRLHVFELANPTAPGFLASPPPGVDLANDADPSLRDAFVMEGRSEERRVGNECRCRREQ